MLHDEAEIRVKSGKGGDGCASFRREKFVAEGGPDGGDGGRGGHVVFRATQHRNTLTPYLRKRVWKARNGEQGGSRQKTGKSGEDLLCEVPCGTLLYHAETGDLIADLTDHEQEVVVVSGGTGGRGNVNFKSSTNQTPRKFTQGKPGVEIPCVYRSN